MSEKKPIREIRKVDETEDSVEVSALFDYGELGARRYTLRIPSKDRSVIVRELREAYKSKKPVAPGEGVELPKEIE